MKEVNEKIIILPVPGQSPEWVREKYEQMTREEQKPASDANVEAVREKLLERSHWSKNHDFPEIVCPQCQSKELFRMTSSETGPAWRCDKCNVRFEITNPSYIKIKGGRKK